MRLGLRLFFYPNYHTHNIPYRCRRKNNPQLKHPKIEDLKRRHHEYQIEEQNMLILRHPYLTVEQSIGYMQEINKNKFPNFLKKYKEERDNKFSKNICLMDRFKHLCKSEAWD